MRRMRAAALAVALAVSGAGAVPGMMVFGAEQTGQVDAGASAGIGQAEAEQAAAETRAGWVWQEDGWYYYEKDGRAGTGWIQDKGYYYYLEDTGRCLTDCLTPDGYYVTGDGAWYRRSASLLGVTFQAPEQFPSLDEGWAGAGALLLSKGTIQDAFQKRTLLVQAQAVEYVSGTDKTVLIGLYKEPEKGCYRLDLAVGLNRDSDTIRAAATYDYSVFRALVYQVTSSPELLEDAIYSSWQEGNTWQIQRGSRVRVGDCEVAYVSDAGCGHYYIYPAGQE